MHLPSPLSTHYSVPCPAQPLPVSLGKKQTRVELRSQAKATRSLHIFAAAHSASSCATAASTLQLPHAKLANYSLQGERRRGQGGQATVLSSRNNKRQPDEQLAG